MNKYFFGILFLFIACSVAAQKKPSGGKPTVIQFIKSTTVHKIVLGGKNVTKVYQGVFKQDNTTFRSDSAYLYDDENALDAFGHVVIDQGDTLHVFSDKLNYQGNTKIAILTDNVKMVDKDATLTTNYFTYNTETKYGTYTGGGKLVNKDNTLISKNGYYFAKDRDAYFRYNVVLTTVDAVIKTDTMRYNSGTRIAYFYGPTNIYGKDKDTLQTENGTYNTQTEQAFFVKKNLYKKGTKSLVGDSLFYDRLQNYGVATRHVTFMDKEQKVIIRGGKGTYTKSDERTVVTQNPYVVLIVEDSVKKGSKKPGDLKTDSGKVVKNTIAYNPHPDTATVKKPDIAKTAPDSAKAKPSIAKAKPSLLKPIKGGKKVLITKAKNDTTATKITIANLKSDTGKVKRDSIYMRGDTIETQIITYQELRYMQEMRHLAGMKDSTTKATVSMVYTKPVKYIEFHMPKMFNDKDYLHPDFFPRKPVVVDTTSKKARAKMLAKIKAAAIGVSGVDSVYITRKINLSDTARVRILVAAHHARIFKSDLQAVADSIFFTYADSVARMYVHPMIWSQGSQLSGDTVNLQLKNKKVDNVEMYTNAFIVNIEKKDSVHFNQLAGRKMRGFFKDNKINVVFVDGNAQTLYYDRDSVKINQILRTVSSRIRVNFGKTTNSDVITWLSEVNNRQVPILKATDDDKILKGFLWKPKDRPVSKEDIISPKAPVVEDKKAKGKKGVPDKKLLVKPEASPVTKPVSLPMKLKTDSTKAKTDTTKHLQLKIDTGKLSKPKTAAIN